MTNCFHCLVILVLCIQQLESADSCCSDSRCRCLPLRNDTYEAECIGLSLNDSTFPRFFNNVLSVSLCDNNIQNLPFPLHEYLPESLKILNISNNKIKKLTKSSFLHLEHLTHLIVKNNYMRYIEQETFSSLVSLQTLDLSGNIHLTFRALRNISCGLQFTDIKALHLNSLHCVGGITTIIFVSDIEYLAKTNLRELHLSNNRLAYFELGALPTLPKSLSIVDISHNALTKGLWDFEAQNLPALTYLDASYKSGLGGIGGFIDCHDWRGPVISKLRQRRHYFKSDLIVKIPSGLRVLLLAELGIGHSLPSLMFNKNNSLQILELKGNNFRDWIGPFQNLHKIKYLGLSNVGGKSVSNDFFSGFSTLEILKIDHNLLGPTFAFGKSYKMFESLIALKELDISYNFINTLPVNIFKHLTSLQVLHLSNNYLTDWKFSIATLKNTQYLDLSSNRLSSLQQKTMEEIDNLSGRNFSINLKDNVLECVCGTLRFMKWMIRNSRIFVDFNSYNCQDEKKKIVPSTRFESKIKELEKQCSDYVGLTLGLFVAIVLCLLICISGIVYRYRWKLRYMYYLGYSKFENIKQTHDHRYEFDAFISYANEDRETVLEIAEALENNYSFRLQIHERDFLGGKSIAENITDTIHKSHKTIVMLSPNFLKSDWGKFEFNMARMESIYARGGDDVIVIVLLKQIKTRDLPLMMMDVIQSKAYIEYSDEEQGQALFWEKLQRSIQAP